MPLPVLDRETMRRLQPLPIVRCSPRCTQGKKQGNHREDQKAMHDPRLHPSVSKGRTEWTPHNRAGRCRRAHPFYPPVCVCVCVGVCARPYGVWCVLCAILPVCVLSHPAASSRAAGQGGTGLRVPHCSVGCACARVRVNMRVCRESLPSVLNHVRSRARRHRAPCAPPPSARAGS